MYKQIIPATDWFYIESSKVQSSIAIHYLAAWGMTENGHVVGLISIAGANAFDENKDLPRLVSVPPSKRGKYKHRDELSEIELKALKNDGYLEKVALD